MNMSDPIQIAEWSFAPETGVLRNGAASTRLEHRAAALLELLVRERGRLVTHEEILEKVWEGRTVSPNSVAVVISDIRRALRDDPKNPKFVETLPKRGYRLIAAQGVALQEPGPVEHARSVPLLAFATLPLIAVLVFAMGQFYNAQAPELETLSVQVSAAVNETGDTQYDALTASVTELLSVELARHETLKVSTRSNATVIISGKLILWDGHPSMSIHAQSAASGEIIWSGMASGPETLLPRQVRREITEFAELAASSENES
jgi:DNA-binding winged helix-turn-helix (wHTH) protein